MPQQTSNGRCSAFVRSGVTHNAFVSTLFHFQNNFSFPSVVRFESFRHLSVMSAGSVVTARDRQEHLNRAYRGVLGALSFGRQTERLSLL
jgi:hypothetical protein